MVAFAESPGSNRPGFIFLFSSNGIGSLLTGDGISNCVTSIGTFYTCTFIPLAGSRQAHGRSLWATHARTYQRRHYEAAATGADLIKNDRAAILHFAPRHTGDNPKKYKSAGWDKFRGAHPSSPA